MQLGFVIDHSRCIGCHACSIACKSENDVPLGDFRTWVKYTESGSFPEVRRSFTVLRCNQCTEPPCVEICPVTALDKREDGIVDVDHRVCIGCKACMQACPYDALYLNESTGTAQKCHFCAHRTERGLAPACTVVCPTEALIPGDFHDRESPVSVLKRDHPLTARKVEAGTKPNVFYRDVHPDGIHPLQSNASGGYLWSNQVATPQLEADMHAALDAKASSRTVYDVAHPPMWGWKVSAYLFTKSIAAGAFLACLPFIAPFQEGVLGKTAQALMSGAALLFLAITTAFLVLDLKRPERFLSILLRPNWDSWLARGSVILMAYGGFATLWFAGTLAGWEPSTWAGGAFNAIGLITAALAAVYTAWLFGQAKGRVLWMQRGLVWRLLVQAAIAGFGLMALLSPWLDLDTNAARLLAWCLQLGLLTHLIFVIAERTLAPKGREEEYARVVNLIKKGPFAKEHLIQGIALGALVPIAVLFLPLATWMLCLAGALSLFGLFKEEDIMVRAGQALPIS